MARPIDTIAEELKNAKGELKDSWESLGDGLRSEFSVPKLIQDHPIEAVTLAVVAGFFVGSNRMGPLKGILTGLVLDQVKTALQPSGLDFGKE